MRRQQLAGLVDQCRNGSGCRRRQLRGRSSRLARKGMDGYTLDHSIHGPGRIRRVRRQPERDRAQQRECLRECHIGQAELEIRLSARGDAHRPPAARWCPDHPAHLPATVSATTRPATASLPQLAQQIQVVVARVGIVAQKRHHQGTAVDDGLRDRAGSRAATRRCSPPGRPSARASSGRDSSANPLSSLLPTKTTRSNCARTRPAASGTWVVRISVPSAAIASIRACSAPDGTERQRRRQQHPRETRGHGEALVVAGLGQHDGVGMPQARRRSD